MRLFLDCEFNGFKGELISMALVSEVGHEWYEVLPLESPVPWVQENVIPVLGKKPMKNGTDFIRALHGFLNQFESIHVVADWPEDIAHFCDALITAPGERINTPPLTMEIIRVDSVSDLPHNALRDAWGIRDHVCAGYCPPGEVTKGWA